MTEFLEGLARQLAQQYPGAQKIVDAVKEARETGGVPDKFEFNLRTIDEVSGNQNDKKPYKYEIDALVFSARTRSSLLRNSQQNVVDLRRLAEAGPGAIRNFGSKAHAEVIAQLARYERDPNLDELYAESCKLRKEAFAEKESKPKKEVGQGRFYTEERSERVNETFGRFIGDEAPLEILTVPFDYRYISPGSRYDKVITDYPQLLDLRNNLMPVDKSVVNQTSEDVLMLGFRTVGEFRACEDPLAKLRSIDHFSRLPAVQIDRKVEGFSWLQGALRKADSA
ncbi:MAG: DNA-directed RNA polymerase subunit alpha C-terminal domain-containing protein [bacterium]|nr:DNA-directed RNA polymerase subunit alpha C-terminal domain-containing protein [bacterium]